MLAALLDAGAEEQDLALQAARPAEAGDGDLVYLGCAVVIEWALRRAAAAEPGVELRGGCTVSGSVRRRRGARARLRGGRGDVRADVVVDALGRYRAPERLAARGRGPTNSGAIYTAGFRLAEDAAPSRRLILDPRGDLGYMGFNAFRGATARSR